MRAAPPHAESEEPGVFPHASSARSRVPIRSLRSECLHSAGPRTRVAGAARHLSDSPRDGEPQQNETDGAGPDADRYVGASRRADGHVGMPTSAG